MEQTHLDPDRAAPRPPDGPPQASANSPTSPPAPGAPPDLRNLNEFHILRRLGEGGMGAVYLGYDGKSSRQVALKVLNDALAFNQAYLDRFRREARSGAALNHPNIVRTYSADQDRSTGKHYLVMEYVDGPSAQILLQKEGKLTVPDAVHVAIDMARALEHAHSRSIVHRDIKPDNILVTRSGVSKLGDLGLAKRTDEASHLTAARQGFGTTAYMPYEQAINAKYADGRSDIYALGATLYHLLTGKVPFPGENHLEVMEKKKHGFFRAAGMLNSDVPPGLDFILGKMLARQPRDRYQTASELIIDLERSHLGAAVPSFADPELAANDPWMQACLSTADPTRLDPNSSGTQTGSLADENVVSWIVRYKNRAGRPFSSRLTTDEVIDRLEEGTLPGDAEAHREGEDSYQPLREIDEFRDRVPILTVERSRPAETTPPEPPRRFRAFYPLLAVAALAAAALVGLGRLLLYR